MLRHPLDLLRSERLNLRTLEIRGNLLEHPNPFLVSIYRVLPELLIELRRRLVIGTGRGVRFRT